MKLLFCKRCHDLFLLIPREVKSCRCGKSSGYYLPDGVTVHIYGSNAICIGISNPTFWEAIHNQPENGLGKEFTAFVIPKECETVEYSR